LYGQPFAVIHLCIIKMSGIGSAPDGTEAQGRILIPEVAHDTDIDDYVVIDFFCC
jgi:hypothetical protein